LGIFDPEEISDAIAIALKYIALEQKRVL